MNDLFTPTVPERGHGDTVNFTYKAVITLPVGRYATDEFVQDLTVKARLAARHAVIALMEKNYPNLHIEVEDADH